jgi:hypothetical protein
MISREAYSLVSDRAVNGPVFVSVLVADNALNAHKVRQERERALARREVRLPEARRRASWGSLTPEERSLLLLSQKEYNSFRASQGGSTQAQAQESAGQVTVTDHGDDDGDDADD